MPLTADSILNDRGRWGSSALFLYEVLTTLDQEVCLVWSGRWTLPKVLYVVSRYVGLATSILTTVVSTFDYTNQFCRIFNPIQFLLILISLTVPDGLLMLRVRALYKQEGQRLGWVPFTLIRYFILGVYGAIILAQIALFIMDFKFSVDNSLSMDIDNFGCLGATGLPTTIHPIGYSSILILSFNSMLFILTLGALARREATSLTTLLLRDGSVYYAIIIALSILLVVMPFELLNRPGIELAALPWSISLTPILACRLFLNLKGFRFNNVGQLDYDDESALSEESEDMELTITTATDSTGLSTRFTGQWTTTTATDSTGLSTRFSENEA